jgi:hypothetical protein
MPCGRGCRRPATRLSASPAIPAVRLAAPEAHSYCSSVDGVEQTGLRGNGLLVVRMDVAPEHAAEVNRWYDEEHVPEKLGIDGFLSVRRYSSTTHPARFLAVYDLADVSAADVRVPATPWTARVKQSWLAVDRGVWSALGPTTARP